MINSLTSKKELLLAWAPDASGDMAVQHARVSGKRITATGEGIPAGFTGPTRVALFSLDSYFEQADLAAASVKLLPLVARRHVDAELVFDDALYRLRTRCRSRGERTIAADIAALPERDLEEALSILPLQQNPCLQLVPMELSVAALVQQATPGPVMVFWEKGGVLISMLVSAGMVQARMRERVSDDDRDIIIGRAESSLRANAGRSNEAREPLLTLYTGDLVGRGDDDSSASLLRERLARLCRGGGKIPADAVLRAPELYGLPFVAEDWSFLDAEYRAQIQAWRYARPVAAVAAVAGIAIGALGVVQHGQAIWLGEQFDERRAGLNAAITEFERERPSDQAMASVRQRLQIQQQSRDEVRLDHMLDWLTHLVPEGVVISSLEMAPVPLPRSRIPAMQVSYPSGEKPFEVNMQIELAETTLDAAEASAAEVVRRLSRRLQMVDSRLQVPAPEPGIRRNVVLVVKARAHAVNFS